MEVSLLSFDLAYTCLFTTKIELLGTLNLVSMLDANLVNSDDISILFNSPVTILF